MGVGAGQQEFDRHDSGDMASGGRRQAGARYSVGGCQGGTSKKLIPSYRRARWPPRTRPPGPARPPSRPGFPGCSGRPLTDEGQRPRVAVGPTPTGRPPESGCRSPSSGSAAAPVAPEEAVLEIPMSLQVGRLAGRRRTLGRITAAQCQVAWRVHGLGVRARLTAALVGSVTLTHPAVGPLLALSAPSYDLGSC
jgi:hypothetical protein